ncbi:hypothetical protein SS50377_22742 [Spironucleus salmonicida]|uniref:Transmembrane protein n=1 Tax=Spironucleus salmonicida TaxID=348837 RepID=A0A9P8LVG0_9EUKA|nr:hypothetical protein SS50377_22742 [Spironucleus salmonicida]
MANDAQKKIVQQNAATVGKLRSAIAAVFAFHLALSYGLRARSVRLPRVCCSCLAMGPVCAIYRALARFAQPSMDGTQTLRNNSPITQGHLFSALFDVVYVLLFCLVLLSFGDGMRWSFLLLPLGAVAVLWVKVARPWLFQSRFDDEGERQKQLEMDQAYAKARERAERGRRKYKF